MVNSKVLVLITPNSKESVDKFIFVEMVPIVAALSSLIVPVILFNPVESNIAPVPNSPFPFIEIFLFN